MLSDKVSFKFKLNQTILHIEWKKIIVNIAVSLKNVWTEKSYVVRKEDHLIVRFEKL